MTRAVAAVVAIALMSPPLLSAYQQSWTSTSRGETCTVPDHHPVGDLSGASIARQCPCHPGGSDDASLPDTETLALPAPQGLFEPVSATRSLGLLFAEACAAGFSPPADHPPQRRA